MKISAINSVNPEYGNAAMSLKKGEKSSVDNSVAINNLHVLSFRGGNPKHVAHAICEEPLFGFMGGGVGTVSNDYNFLSTDVDKVGKFIPMYNQENVYKKEIVCGKVVDIKERGVKKRVIPYNLSNDHPFKKYEGQCFVTAKEISKRDDLAEFLEKNAKDVFILEELGTGKINWGMEENVPVAAYRAIKDEKLKKAFMGSKDPRFTPAQWEEMWNKLEWYFTYVDTTSGMPKQYAKGGYATASGGEVTRRISAGWQGMPYSKYDKALVEMAETVTKKTGFDPAYFLCSDGQMQPIIHFAAVKNASGDKYWQDRALGGVGHNMNNGYIDEMGTKDMIVNLGSKKDIEKILNSREYWQAVRESREEEFLKSLIPSSLQDGYGKYNACMFTINYAEKGYAPMYTTVSDLYARSVANNELVSPALQQRLKNLEDAERFKGIINVLMDPVITGFGIEGYQPGFKEDCELMLKDGTKTTVKKFLAYDKNKAYDINHIREVKRQNLLNYLDRLDPKYVGSKVIQKGVVSKDETSGFGQIVCGKAGRKAVIRGGISKEYIEKIARGEDVTTFVTWARGDFQKGMDTAVDAFEKFVAKTGDKNSILLVGGDMSGVPEVVKKIENTKLKGRILHLDGWAPGLSFAAVGDYSILPSRFAPCELSDLESIKYGCTPIVPNVQGMAQKIFDPTEDSPFTNGYKGKHEYFMTVEEAYEAAGEDAKKIYDGIKEKAIKEIIADYEKKIGEKPDESYINAQITKNKKYLEACKSLRDSVISDEISDCMARAIKDRKENPELINKMLKNQVDLKTTWEENGWLTPDGRSSGQLYRDYHFNNKNYRNLKEGEALHLNLDGLHDLVENKPKTEPSFAQKLRNFANKTEGRWVIGTAAVAALIGVGCALAHSKDPKDEKKSDNLALIG